ncbi:MAG: hypothetical protein ACRECO_21495 [Xanthobacteraceae bacterium]
MRGEACRSIVCWANEAFDPDHCQAMGVAFERVLQELNLKDREDPTCNLIAKKIIEFGQQGVREPAIL